mmetsp:Transcript_50374/g.133784  ORF Transcript_50374/g.133784 Transcript_50374/m.133784 type:complete len:331 (-) Transcript_50374:110-1102(-)
METALHGLLQSILGSYVNGIENMSAEFPLTLRDLKLRDQQINKEIAAGGAFPFDIASGSIGLVSVTPSWTGNVELALNDLVVNFSFNPFRAMKGAMRAAEVKRKNAERTERARSAGPPVRRPQPNPNLSRMPVVFPTTKAPEDEWELDAVCEVDIDAIFQEGGSRAATSSDDDATKRWLQTDILPPALQEGLSSLSTLLKGAPARPRFISDPWSGSLPLGFENTGGAVDLGPEVPYTAYVSDEKDSEFMSFMKRLDLTPWASCKTSSTPETRMVKSKPPIAQGERKHSSLSGSTMASSTRFHGSMGSDESVRSVGSESSASEDTEQMFLF